MNQQWRFVRAIEPLFKRIERRAHDRSARIEDLLKKNSRARHAVSAD
jgi:hypothetical protein